MNLKAKCGEKATVLRGVDPSAPLLSLQLLLESHFDVSPKRQRLLTGYPPKPILGMQPDEPLSKYFRTGDSLVVETIQGGEAEGGLSQTSSLGSMLVVRKIPDDNSCCFHALAYTLESKSRTHGPILRRNIAKYIREHPEKYNESTLAKSNQEYAAWIEKPLSWGGEIELDVASDLYDTEIVVMDASKCNHIFIGQKEGRNTRVYLMYTGIHYDAIALAKTASSGEDQDVTRFSADDEDAFKKALGLCKKWHSEGKYTDTSTFALQCNDCGESLKGETELIMHASKTAHMNYSEYKKK